MVKSGVVIRNKKGHAIIGTSFTRKRPESLFQVQSLEKGSSFTGMREASLLVPVQDVKRHSPGLGNCSYVLLDPDTSSLW